MTSSWLVIAALCVGTVILKASGPAILRERRPPGSVMAVIALVAPAILTGLVLYEAFTGKHSGIVVDARGVGLITAAAAALAKQPMIVVVALAATTTAVTRLLV